MEDAAAPAARQMRGQQVEQRSWQLGQQLRMDREVGEAILQDLHLKNPCLWEGSPNLGRLAESRQIVNLAAWADGQRYLRVYLADLSISTSGVYTISLGAQFSDFRPKLAGNLLLKPFGLPKSV